MDETDRRRAIQQAYNEANDITPQTIIKPIDMSLVAVAEGRLRHGSAGFRRRAGCRSDPGTA